MSLQKILLTLALTIFIFAAWFIWPVSFFVTVFVVFALFLDAQAHKVKKK